MKTTASKKPISTSYKKYFTLILFIVIFYNAVFSQERFAIISDTQQPLPIEKLWNKQWDSKNEKNTESRDLLFNSLLNEKISTLFFLGDLVGIGSNNKQWKDIDIFLDSLKARNIKTYAIAGNHEYLLFPKKGINNLYKRFPGSKASIQVQTIDSISLILLNTNFGHISKEQKAEKVKRYEYLLDSLQQCPAVKIIIVGTHQPPFTNSKKIKPDKEVQQLLIPGYLSTPKAILFISGHSHNLEHFIKEKDFLVIGGGGGLHQGILKESERRYENQTWPDFHIRFFYLLIERNKDKLTVTIKGLKFGDTEKWIERSIVL